ncbi:MAG TPA: proton-conducting transporter membrane subunit [Rickettsiales bacterium]|nr:proton-conducting transporter membrane subunit [Rickettsiales bacterium]
MIISFIAYQLLVLSNMPLIGFFYNKQSKAATKTYFRTLFLSGFVLILPAIIFVYYKSGGVNFIDEGILSGKITDLEASIILALFTVGVAKNSIMPFNYWLPKMYYSAAPVSAMIHSVTGVKASLLITLKVILYIFGLDYVNKLTHQFFYGGWILYLCGINAVYTAYLALKTHDIKKRLIYSTVGQMSYIVSMFLVGTKMAILAGITHIITHSFAKSILFLIAGAINSTYKTRKTHAIASVASNHKIIMSCFILAGFSIIGMPLLPGSISKDLMIIADLQSHHYEGMIFVITGSILNIMYIYPIAKATFGKNVLQKKELPKLMSFVIISLAIIMLISLYFVTKILPRYL